MVPLDMTHPLSVFESEIVNVVVGFVTVVMENPVTPAPAGDEGFCHKKVNVLLMSDTVLAKGYSHVAVAIVAWLEKVVQQDVLNPAVVAYHIVWEVFNWGPDFFDQLPSASQSPPQGTEPGCEHPRAPPCSISPDVLTSTCLIDLDREPSHDRFGLISRFECTIKPTPSSAIRRVQSPA